MFDQVGYGLINLSRTDAQRLSYRVDKSSLLISRPSCLLSFYLAYFTALASGENWLYCGPINLFFIMFSDLLKNRELSAELGKQASTKSFLRFPKISLERWRSLRAPAIITLDVNKASNNDERHYITIMPDSKLRSTSQVRETKASPRKQPIIIQEHKLEPTATRRSSISQDRLPRSQERYLSATTTTHLTPSRSNSRSRLAFARSRSNPGYQRIITIPETTNHHKRQTSVDCRQRGRSEDKCYEVIEISRGRRSRHSSISTSRARRSENRTPSPLPALEITPAGTPCSSRSLGPSTPVPYGSEDHRTNLKEKIPIIMTISPDRQIDAKDTGEVSSIEPEYYEFPETYYKPRYSVYQSSKSPQRSHYDSNDASRHRKLVVDTDLSDGSRLRSVSSGRACITTAASRISSIPVLTQDPSTPQESILSSSITTNIEHSLDPLTQRPEKLQPGSDQSSNSAADPSGKGEMPVISPLDESTIPHLLPRKPVSFERLRPPSMSYQAEVTSPLKPMPLHRRTKSEVIPTESPLTRDHTRSISTYSYTPIRDLRPERRSYNTVRFLDSQGQNHERLRRVLGI